MLRDGNSAQGVRQRVREWGKSPGYCAWYLSQFGFEGKLTNARWAALDRCSADTALRDINDLLARGVLRKLQGAQYEVRTMCKIGS